MFHWSTRIEVPVVLVVPEVLVDVPDVLVPVVMTSVGRIVASLLLSEKYCLYESRLDAPGSCTRNRAYRDPYTPATAFWVSVVTSKVTFEYAVAVTVAAEQSLETMSAPGVLQ
jgi:hypothetical protein